MHTFHRSALTATLMLAFAAAPLPAQGWRWDVGLHGGYAWWSSILDEDHLGVGTEDVSFEPGWLAGAQATYWIPGLFGLRNTLGLRANFGYTERSLEQDDLGLIDDINLWSGSADVLFRLLGAPAAEFRSMEWSPYLALGIGEKVFNPAGDATGVTNADEGEGDTGAPFLVGGRPFFLAEEARVMGLAALGTDLRLARRFALRLEVGDRFYEAPIFELGFDGNLLEDDADDIGDVVHELYGEIGLHAIFGLERPPVVALLPPPAPPAPPLPAEEMVRVCVIDPTAAGGTRRVDALYVPSTGDTLVVVEGGRLALEDALRDVRVAGDARWFRLARPLTMTAGGESVEFVAYGLPHAAEADDLAFLGLVESVPIYARRDDARQLEAELAELRRRGDQDLTRLFADRPELWQEFADVRILYVPVAAAGCIVQPLRRVQDGR